MSYDVQGNLAIRVEPDVSRFGPMLQKEMVKAAKLGGDALNKAMAKSGGIFSALTGQVRAFSKSLDSIDPARMGNVAKAAGTIGTAFNKAGAGAAALDKAMSGINSTDIDRLVPKVEQFGAALRTVDGSQFRAVASGFRAADTALKGMPERVTALNAALDSIDSRDLLSVASASRTAGASLTAAAGSAETLNLILDRIDANELRSVAAGSAAASGSMTAAGASAGFFAGHMQHLKTGLIAGGAALAALSGFGVKAAADLEQVRVAFTGILGSQQKADAFIVELQNFAAKTPFEFTQLTKATQKFLALGQSTDEAIKNLTIVGNAVSTVGGSAESIDRVVLALSQIQSKGKLSAEELNQISESLPNFSRIALYDTLAAKLNTTRAGIVALAEDGKIAATDAMPALMDVLSKMPGALGAMDRQALTLTGRLSTLRDVVKMKLITAFQPLADVVKENLEPLTETIGNILPVLGAGLATLGGGVIPSIVAFLKSFGIDFSSALGQVSAAVAPMLGQLGADFGGFLGTLSKVLGPILAALLPVVIEVASALAAGLGAALLELTPSFVRLIEALLPLLPLLTDLAVTVLALLVPALINWIDNALIPAATWLVNLAKPLADHPNLMKALAIAVIGVGAAFKWWRFIGDITTSVVGLKKQVGTFFGVLKAHPLGIAAVAIAALAAAAVLAYQNIEPFRNAVDAVASGIRDVFQPVIENVVGSIQTLIDIFTSGEDVAQGFGEVLDNTLGNTSAFVTPIRLVGERIMGVVGAVQRAIDLMPALWESFTLGDTQGIAEILDNVMGNTGEWVDPIRDAADTVKTVFNGVMDTARAFGASIVDNVGPAVTRLWDTLGGGAGVLNWLGDRLTWLIENWRTVSLVIFAVSNPIGLLIAGLVLLYAKFEPVRTIVGLVVETLAEFAGGVASLAGGVLGRLVDGVTGVIQVLQGLFTLDFGRVLEGLQTLGGAIIGAFAIWVADLPILATTLVQGILDAVLGALSQIPLIGNLFEGLKTIVGGVADVLRGLYDVIGGILTLDWGRIVSGLGGALAGIKDALAGFFGGLGGFLHDLFTGALSLVWTAVTEGVPALLGAFGTLLSNLPGWLLTALTALGGVIVSGVTAAFDAVVDNGPGILSAVGSWLADLPGKIIGALGDLGSLLAGWFVTAFKFVVTNVEAGLNALFGFIFSLPGLFLKGLAASIGFLATFIIQAAVWTVKELPGILGGVVEWFETSLPGLLLAALLGLGGFLVGAFVGAALWLKENLPVILGGVIEWFEGLPGLVLGALAALGAFLVASFTGGATWLKDNLPGILGGVIDWFEGLPGMIWAKVGDLGAFLREKLFQVFEWIKTELPGILGGVVDWFEGLPGLIFNKIVEGAHAAAGVIGDLAKKLWNGIARFVNEYLLAPLRTFTVTVVGQNFTPFEFIPTLPEFAKGGIATRPTAGIFGEAGPEALVPLSDPARGAAVARAAGIPQMLAKYGGGAGVTIGQLVVQANVTISGDVTNERAHEIGTVFGEAAGDAAQRRLQIRADVHRA